MPATDTVTLRFSPGEPRIRVRELTGADERAVSGTATENALRLLDALMIAPPDGAAPPDAADLVGSDRDRLLVAIYRRAFGDRIENTLNCGQCRQPFDIDFSLSSLVSALEEGRDSPRVRQIGPNRFETEEGLRFKLPTGRDELSLAALPATEVESGLLQCCGSGDDTAVGPSDVAALQALLAEVAPLVDLELDARCPECRHVHAVQFDIQSYLLGAIVAERARLAQEVHRVAIAYGWSWNEILTLTRAERRQFIELIENEAAARARRYLA